DVQARAGRRTRCRDVNVYGAGGDSVRQQVAQDDAERCRRQRQRRRDLRRDLDLGVEILECLRGAFRPGGERRFTRSAPRRLEQRIDEEDRVLDGLRRIIRDQRAEERGLQLMRDERGEVLERLVALRELDRRSSQALLGRTTPDDRRERGQRGL